MKKTNQEIFWEGNFGDNFHDRIDNEQYFKSNRNLFENILSFCKGVNSILELGAGGGNNLKAIHDINKTIDLYAIEMSNKACKLLSELDYVTFLKASILDDFKVKKADLVFTKTVLIHINPEKIKTVYKKLFELSNKYILIVEYFNPTPVSVKYRGYENVLFKRDFAKEMISEYNLKIVNYGFVWSKDKYFPLDDVNWFLFEKL